MDTSKTSTAIVVGIIALVIGAAGGMAIGKSKDDGGTQTSTKSQTSTATDTKAANLRVALNGLEKEHVDLAAAATRAGFDGSPMFDSAAKATLQNSKELSDAVASVYGEEAGKKFNEIFDSHITFFVDYTKAAKAGDQAGMDKAVQNLNGYVEAISVFLSGANPNLPKDAVAQLFTEHVGLLKAAVDAHGAGNYDESYSQQRKAVTQIGTIADTLSGAIVKQKPENFKG